jgi:hypothetical protein
MTASPEPAASTGDAVADDFIEVYPDALDRSTCAAIVARFATSPDGQAGQVGGGVYPELKHSHDITITGRAEWQDVEQQFNAVLARCLIRYLRRYPQALISSLMLQRPDRARYAAEEFAELPEQEIGGMLARAFRPGAINLQRYTAGEGGYPYWHCELYPRAPDAETLHRHLLWTLYLNDGFEAGETEFLFQRRKITPRTGTLLLAPTAFTHTHRGNRPQGGDKVIATSWVMFQRAEQLFARR